MSRLRVATPLRRLLRRPLRGPLGMCASSPTPSPGPHPTVGLSRPPRSPSPFPCSSAPLNFEFGIYGLGHADSVSLGDGVYPRVSSGSS
eukprot:9681423-Alexandrium_andersonii.AAC.1